MPLHHEGSCLPVTALAFWDDLLLSGHGPYLRIYNAASRSSDTCADGHVTSHDKSPSLSVSVRQDALTQHDVSALLVDQQIFDAQAIHGISVRETSTDTAAVLLWGGQYLRVVRICRSETGAPRQIVDFCLGQTCSAQDWILDVEFRPVRYDGARGDGVTTVLITAHDAISEVVVLAAASPVVSIRSLTSTSRCVLYSAHVLWLSPTRILAAAGTVFGEVIVWSYDTTSHTKTVHYIFTGHEGSIFGVRISDTIERANAGAPQRLLASCSDDRTIRVWDISDLSEEAPDIVGGSHDRETGFGSNSVTASDQQCLALSTRSHDSRVWSVRFVLTEETAENAPLATIISAGEDATCRTWQPSAVVATGNPGPAFRIQHISTSAHHAGKNIWSLAVHGNEQVATGGADGRIVLASISTNEERVADSVSRQEEWTLEEALSNANARAEPPETCEVSGPDNKQSSVDLAQDSAEAHPSRHISDAPDEAPETKKEKKKTKKSPKPISDSFRTYAFVSEKSILVTTSAGVVMLATMENRGLQWQELGRNSDLRGYSVTTGVNSMGIGLFAGTGGSLYYYDDRTEQLQSIVTRQDGKVSAILAEPVVSAEGEREALGVVLTYVGSDVAKSLVLRRSTRGLDVERIASLQLLPSFIVTSAARVSFNERLDSVFLGSRNGDIAVYLNRLNETHESTSLTPCRVLQNVHGQDAVTTMRWISADHIATEAASGCLVSVGRDGTCAIHQCKTETRHIETLLVHQARTPFGPNVEGVHIELATDTLIFYGFRSKQFVVYNESNNEEIMTIECGGAHRNWSFNPTPKWTGGTFVWTKASKLKLLSQPEAAHRTICSGGHGREIKALAVSPASKQVSTYGQLIATGAEDTDIRIFAYDTRSRKRFRCLRILRKHVTGVQKLQWSQDGRYLFSCGGFEEFFVWRVRSVSAIGVGVVCESVCPPGVEQPDLRIMSFSAWQEEAAVAIADAELERDAQFLVTMAYSDSTVKASGLFSSFRAPRKHWQLLLTGNYLTCCLTQSAYLLQPRHFVLATASTDGHLALWTLGAPLTHSRDAAAVVPRAAEWRVRLRIHQSTIKCMAEHILDADTWLLVTGGDDNALALTRIDSIDCEVERATLLVPSAHAAAVTALAVLSGPREPVQGRRRLRVVTSSNDQRIKVWAVSVDLNARGVDGIVVEKVDDIFTPVADVSSMEVMEDDGSGARVLVCGVGMDLWRLSR